MVADFHRRGVKVYLPINMWDEGTRDPGRPWPHAVADLMKQVDADGVFGDTQDGVPLAFPIAAEKTGHPVAFQTELWPSDEDVAWNLSSWWQEAPSVYQQFAPPIDRYKWIEPRHIPVVATRWSRDKTDAFQVAFFNGVGIESWENIFGFWNGLTARDGEALRRVATVMRGVAPFLVSQEWEPFYPMRNFGVFSSRWPLSDQTVWTVVNRNEYVVEGRQMSVPFKAGERYFDLYRGEELKPEHDGDNAVLSFPVEGRGYGAILATSGAPDAAMTALMAKMKTLSAKPLSQISQAWAPLPQHQTAIAATKAAKAAPTDMVAIPGGAFDFRVQGIEVEGSDQDGVDIAYPWENSPRRFHRHQMTVHPFFIDRHNVTNAEFKAFLDASHYQPKDPANFLKDWKNGTYPDGWADKPVTWVSIEDARAYAAWAGKRLPHEWEWQYAAQGSDGRAYPWGAAWQDDAVPKPNTARTLRGPDDDLGPSRRRQPVRSDGSGGQCLAMDRRIYGRAYAFGDPARRQLLPAARLALVFPGCLSQRPARQISVDGAVQGPRRHGGFPLRGRHRARLSSAKRGATASCPRGDNRYGLPAPAFPGPPTGCKAGKLCSTGGRAGIGLCGSAWYQ